MSQRLFRKSRIRSRRTLGEQLEPRCLLATLVVNSTDDDDLAHVSAAEVTLRSAIEFINAQGDAINSITFNLPQNARTIVPHTALPTIQVPVVLDGNAANDPGLAPVEISGAFFRALNPRPQVNGLVLDLGSDGSAVLHLAINRFTSAGIVLNSDHNVVASCYLGVDPTGRIDSIADPPGNNDGVLVNGAGNIVGGDDAAQGNVISANDRYGFWLRSQSAEGTTIRNNTIGLDATGVGRAGNQLYGVFMDASSNNIVRDNVIGANRQSGVQIEFAGGGANQVTHNWIGVSFGGANLSNGGDGLRIAAGGRDNDIKLNNIENNLGHGISVLSDPQGNFSVNNTLQENRIAHNSADGVFVDGADNTRIDTNTIEANGRNGVTIVQRVDPVDGPTARNRMRHNLIFENVGLGIDLVKTGEAIPAVTPNDDLDADSNGGNYLQNAPELTAAAIVAGAATVTGRLRVSGAATSYHLEFFASDALDPSQHGEGQTFVAERDVSATAGQTLVEFSVPLGTSLADGQFVTATATDANGNTSEFSRGLELVPPLAGTPGDDTLVFRAGAPFVVELNGYRYEFAEASFNLNFDGLEGNDSVRLYGGPEADTASLRPGAATLTSADYQIKIANTETIRVYSGGGGADERAVFYDSAADDEFYTTTAYARLSGPNFYNRAEGFARAYAYATAGGNDRAYFYDSVGNDAFYARGKSQDAYMTGAGFYNYARYFERNYAYGTEGGADDRAYFYDSLGNDQFYSRGVYRDAYLTGDGIYDYARYFERNYAYATAGGADDRAYFYDSAGNDAFTSRAQSRDAYLTGDGIYNYASAFERNFAYATAGGADDRAYFYDSAGNDRFYFRGQLNTANLTADGVNNYAESFDRNYAYASAGGSDDRAYFYDSAGDDKFYARASTQIASLEGSGIYGYARYFDFNYAYATAGGANDQAFFYDSTGDDRFYARGLNRDAYLTSAAFYGYARGFDRNSAYATSGGNDQALLYDSAEDDAFFGRGVYGRMTGAGLVNYVSDFDAVTAYGNNGGMNRLDVAAVDYVFRSVGAWTI